MFSIQPSFNGRESIAVIHSCHKLNEEYRISKIPIPGSIPIGDIDYCSQVVNFTKTPIDFYPEFLSYYRKRKIFLSNKSNSMIGMFIKSATEFKSEFGAKVAIALDEVPEGLYYVSEPVEFVQEWRYYVCNERVYTTGWYDGYDEDEPAPHMMIDWPEDFCGAVDFGKTKDNDILLIESHPPFACGWYGEDHLDYVKWQKDSWHKFSRLLVQ